MELVAYNHAAALVGSLVFILFRVWKFINRRQSGEDPRSWREYFSTTWDDFLVLVIIGQGLVFIQESFFSAWLWFTNLSEDPTVWDKYYDSEEAIAFGLGVFGVAIFTRLTKIGKDKIEKTNK